MASIELLVLIALAGGLLSYLGSRLHTYLGSAITIFISGFVFVSVLYYGLDSALNVSVSYLPEFMEFGTSQVGTYFAMIVTFVFFMVSFFHPYYVDQINHKHAYGLLFLFALAGALGVFFASEFITLFFFFELVVWSSLFLIPLAGKTKPAAWYYGFSLTGSFSLLLAVFLMYQASGTTVITDALAGISGTQAGFAYLLLAVAAFAKLGAFPLHIWLPKVLTNSPDPVTSVFSGGLEKLGAFVAFMVLVRFSPVGAMIDFIGLTIGQYVIAFLGALTIIFGTLMAIRQDDAKTLLAYSSMSNGGYILVALAVMTDTSVSGALYHVLAHAIASTAAFLAIGAVQRQTGTTKMSELGGMIHKMPISYLVYLIAIISMAGIPPMGGFISKWLIFQSVINEGLIIIGIATFFGSIGSFLYVFRPLAALFLGQELPQYKTTIKEAPLLMLIPMLVLSILNIVTGVLPSPILEYINTILAEANISELTLTLWVVTGNNGDLFPALISGIFAVGVAVAFVIFILLKKSRKVELMDTYTAGNFIYTEELMHYSVDFYAPIERLYEKYTTLMKDFYENLAHKVKEFGNVVKYFIFSHKPEITVLWIILIVVFLLWGDVQ
jgi:NADH-quinone oxidoreductase subunit M